ncbi:MAG: HAMP domain-containing histidine kinase [Betaproteobacteria bacterium]|nr:HAMP domain-containing histidine kinase [Betaproteobacteria bacterium]
MKNPYLQAAMWQPGQSRWESLRYYSLYRLVLASGLGLVSHAFISDQSGISIWMGVVAVYFFAALLLLYFQRLGGLSFAWVLNLQILVDIAVLSVLMYFSGGNRGGMPYILMVVVAAGGLLGEGRLVYFYAALATVGVLVVQSIRYVYSGEGDPTTEFAAVGLLCVGFFAVATVARLLAQRALKNEQLAYQRGSALTRQILVNERIIADLHDGVLVVGEDGVLRQLNPKAAKLLGGVARPGMALERVSQALAGALANSAAQTTLEDNGQRVRLRVHAAGNAGDRVIFLEDLEQIELEAQQIKLAALGRLTGSIAHEIRNPLAAISHAGELLAEEKRAVMQTRLIRIVLDNSRRIERMVADVLELGRRDRVTQESIPFADFMRVFIEDNSSFGSLDPQLVRCDIPPELRIRFDRIHLHQVLWNLINNAKRYCSGKPDAVRVTARPAEHGCVLVEISDDGQGFSPEIRNRVFEPFFTTDSKGTGLGLYIARELAQANDATLELDEAPVGAHFSLLAEGGA